MTPAFTIAALVVAVLAIVALLVCIASFKRALRIERAKTARADAAAYHWFDKHRTVEARLAKFTAPRERDAKGHYLPMRRNAA